MQHRYQMHLYFDDTRYVAEVPELSNCKGFGESYLEAVKNAEIAISEWICLTLNSGESPPEPATDFVWQPKPDRLKRSPTNGVIVQLHKKYGNLSNRDLAAKMGLQHVNPSTFAGATVGKGSRVARCTIAYYLGEPPSKIWPDMTLTIKQRDDEVYFGTIAELEAEKDLDKKKTP